MLLAQNKQGYHTILQLVTDAHFAERAGACSFVGADWCCRWMVLSLCFPLFTTRCSKSLVQGDATGGGSVRLAAYKSVFGQNLFVGISPQNPTPKDGTAVAAPTEALIALAREQQVGVVPAPLIYLLDESDQEARDVLLRIQRGTLSNLEEEVFEDPLLFPDRAAIEAWCQTVCPEALQTLSDLLTSIDWELELGNWVFPNPPTGDDVRDHRVILREYVEQGFARRGLERTEGGGGAH